MSTVKCSINASSAEIFGVLADGWLYSNWVVGTSHMRAVETSWPNVGSRLFHASGTWPAVVRDETVVEAMTPQRRLVLLARGWPFGQARVVIEIDGRVDGATLVTMTETPVSGPGKWLHNPVSEVVLTRRNVECLARLAALAERHTHPTD